MEKIIVGKVKKVKRLTGSFCNVLLENANQPITLSIVNRMPQKGDMIKVTGVMKNDVFLTNTWVDV